MFRTFDGHGFIAAVVMSKGLWILATKVVNAVFVGILARSLILK